MKTKSSIKIIGIDEVGRGPLAGPVTVCAVVCAVDEYKKIKRLKSLPVLGKDSKKLKEKDRERFQKVLTGLASSGKISYSIFHISNIIIDTKGISFAIKTAIAKNLQKLKVSNQDTVLLDGGLKAPTNFIKQKTIIKGDEKEKIIAWASILAKVERDGLMKRIHKKFPEYGFDIHKGYGTKRHKEAIKKHGISVIHRKTWIS